MEGDIYGGVIFWFHDHHRIQERSCKGQYLIKIVKNITKWCVGPNKYFTIINSLREPDTEYSILYLNYEKKLESNLKR